MGDDDRIQYGPPAPAQIGPALPFIDQRLGNFLQAQIAAGASPLPGTPFAVTPRDDNHLYDSLTATLAPYVGDNGLTLARTTVRGVPLTLSVDPTLHSVSVILEGKFG